MTSRIHPTAIVHPQAELHPSVEVGAYAVIGARVSIGARTTVGSHAIVEGPAAIGADNRLFPGAVIGLEPQDLKYRGEESWVEMGDGNTVREYATVNRATGEGKVTRIGNRVLLMAYVHVAHNCEIGDEVTIANNAALAGHVCIEPKARIGGVVGIHQFVRVGSLAMVGGMSRIDRDVPPYTTVEGNPARVRSLNLVGLQRAGFGEAELGELKKAFRLLYRSGHSFREAIALVENLSDAAAIQHLHRFLSASLGSDRRGAIPGASSAAAEEMEF